MAAKEAFDVAKEVIQAHDVRFVREFMERRPVFIVEAWYYGMVKDAGEEIVIRTTARNDTNTLEVFVACSNLASMTGLLAELGQQLKKAVSGVSVSNDQKLQAVLRQTAVLMDKYAEAEVSPAE